MLTILDFAMKTDGYGQILCFMFSQSLSEQVSSE